MECLEGKKSPYEIEGMPLRRDLSSVPRPHYACLSTCVSFLSLSLSLSLSLCEYTHTHFYIFIDIDIDVDILFSHLILFSLSLLFSQSHPIRMPRQ